MLRHKWSALTLLLTGLFTAFAWQIAPYLWPMTRETVGHLWNISGAALRIVLFLMLMVAYPSWEMRAVSILLMTFDLMVAGCSTAYLYNPWPIDPTQEACSQRLHIPLGLAGALMGLVLVLSIARGRK